MSALGRHSPVLAILAACGCRHDLPPAAPGPPIRAEAEVALRSADAECGDFVAALEHYGACRNADEDLRSWAKRVADLFTSSFQASQRSAPDADADRVMAQACHRAARSVGDAATRCAKSKSPASED